LRVSALAGHRATSDLNQGFKGVNWALLIGSVPRKAGMERGDLLGINGKIFTGQARRFRTTPRATFEYSLLATRATPTA
jgi:malate/lactate dehydrogenase